MNFEFKVVKCRQNGNCYVCEHTSKYDERSDVFVDSEETVNSFSVNNTIVRLCDKHLRELISEADKFLDNK